MQSENIQVANVKCGGCASIIKEGLQGMDGVDTVDVDVAGGVVSVRFSTPSLTAIKTRLTELGYPPR
jgi:copper chaperone CopZ